MRIPLFFLLVSSCLLPSPVWANEPARGTVIMVSSIGAWVLFTSCGMVLRERRKARARESLSLPPQS